MARHVLFWLLLTAIPLAAADLPLGQVIDSVVCTADARQNYTLYLPTSYSADRTWPVILAFDPGARGRRPVERYQAAAEKYGYIVAGSNVSRNGSWNQSMDAAQAMAADVGTRFRVDPRRLYLAGMSGGSRVAMGVAMSSGDRIAGVIASSAGFPDSKPRKSVSFAVYGTAGTEDFNLLEMRQMHRELKSPNHLDVFEGGHVWLPAEAAMRAVEWMELQAVATGRIERTDARLKQLWEIRNAALATASPIPLCAQLESLAADFTGLADTTAVAARAKSVCKEKPSRDAVREEQREETREKKWIGSVLVWETQLRDQDTRMNAMTQLRNQWKELATEAAAPGDTPVRRTARRVLSGLASSVRARMQDPEYLKMVSEFRPARDRNQ